MAPPKRANQPLYRLAHDVAERLHAALAERPRAAQAYFRGLSLLRALPDGSYKQRVLNSVASTSWPELELPFRSVELSPSTRVRLRPHPGEMDMRALICTKLGYERAVFEWLDGAIDGYDTIVEIGANVGVYTVFFGVRRRETRDGLRPRVLSFEPAPRAFRRLQQNLEANDLSVESFQCAVADRAGLLDFFEPKDHLTNGSLREQFAGYFSKEVERRKVLAVDGTTITQLIGEPGRWLLKIDVEGAEARVLSGLQALIERDKPDILIEVLPIFADELRALSFLRDAGYCSYAIENGGLTERAWLDSGKHGRDLLLRASIP